MSCRLLSNHCRRRFVATYGDISGFAPVFELDFVVLSLAFHTWRSQKTTSMKQEAQAAHARKDPKLPADTTLGGVCNSLTVTTIYAVTMSRRQMLASSLCSTGHVPVVGDAKRLRMHHLCSQQHSRHSIA